MAALRFADLHLPLQAIAAVVSDGAAVLAGVRPEHFDIALDAGSGLAGQVELIEQMGLSSLVHLTIARNALKVLSFKRFPLSPGMAVSVAPEQVHLFDPNSGRPLN